MRLLKTKIIKGKILCETGLHIGGSMDVIEIGGVDNPVIKHPITREPYIPGSSLKGKMRSLLEKKEGKMDGGAPCGCGECIACRIFGPHRNLRHNLGPTRILVRDAHLSAEVKEDYKKLLDEGKSFLEIKTETSINRNTGAAANGSLRTQERVPSGAIFDMELALQIFDKDDEALMINTVKMVLKEVEKSYLGGSGSRGSGKVSFKELTIDDQPFEL